MKGINRSSKVLNWITYEDLDDMKRNHGWEQILVMRAANPDRVVVRLRNRTLGVETFRSIEPVETDTRPRPKKRRQDGPSPRGGRPAPVGSVLSAARARLRARSTR